MKVAVLVQAHKDLELVNRLVGALAHPRVQVYVSMDAKADADLSKLDSRARFVERRRTIYWGSFALVESTLDAFAAIERDGDYGYLINISGQDYPVWESGRIADFLEKSGGGIFVHHAPLAPGGWAEAADRVEYWHYTGAPSRARSAASAALRGAMRLLGLKRRMPEGMTAYGGANWHTLPREAVREVLAFVDANPAYVEFMRSVSIPDEVFIQTILLNGPLRAKVVNENHRYVDWSEKRPNPKLLTAADYPAIAASGKMFCRKLDRRVSLGLLDLLDAGRKA